MACLSPSSALTRSTAGCQRSMFRACKAGSARPPVRCQAHGAHGAHPQHTTSSARRDVLLGLGTLALTASNWSPAHAQECTLNTSADGIQFCELTEGSGDAPVKGSLIRCHYVGKLASNNRVFDSSYDRGRPLTFKIGVREVIAGWDEGILGGEGIPPMKEGGKRRLIIPPGLAYGERGAGGGIIPPNSTLVFDVELLPRRR